MLLVIDSLKVRGLWDEKEQGDKKNERGNWRTR
jgi:hypothetical protein